MSDAEVVQRLLESVGIKPSHVLADDVERLEVCLLYTSEAADDLLCVDLGGRRIIEKTITPP